MAESQAPRTLAHFDECVIANLQRCNLLVSSRISGRDRVQFEVLEEIKISDVVIVPKGGIAWGTVTEAQPKRRMARGGKLEIVMDSVRAGGTPFHTTQTNAVEFPGAALSPQARVRV